MLLAPEPRGGGIVELASLGVVAERALASTVAEREGPTAWRPAPVDSSLQSSPRPHVVFQSKKAF
jgi:hypothetical protein